MINNPDRFHGLNVEVDTDTRVTEIRLQNRVDALYRSIFQLCASWTPDPIRNATLERLKSGDTSAAPYFKNLLINVTHNSTGIERRGAQRVLLAHFNHQVLP